MDQPFGSDNPNPGSNPLDPITSPILSEQLPSREERTWALVAHLSTLSNCIGIPGFVGPLIIYLIKRDEMPFASRQAKEALNFQISIFIYVIVSVVLMLVAIGVLLLIAIGIVSLIFTIVAAVKANDGFDYRYPMTIRLIS